METKEATMDAKTATMEVKGFKIDEHVSYAGRHLLIDVWEATELNEQQVEAALREMVADCGASLLFLKTHQYSPQGVTGAAVLAESHITIHTWPEISYVAVDIFLCGQIDPYKALPALMKAFKTEKIQLSEVKRGLTVK